MAPVNLREAFTVLWRRKWVVALGVLLGVGVGGWFAYQTPKRYRSVAAIRLADTRRAMTSGLVDPGENGPVLNNRDPLLSQIEVLTSRNIAGEVVDSIPALRVRLKGIPSAVLDSIQILGDYTADSLGADSFYVSFTRSTYTVANDGRSTQAPYGAAAELNGFRFKVLRPPPELKPGALAILPREDAINGFLKTVEAKPRENTDVIDVAVTVGDPRLSQRMVNTLVRVFRGANIEAAQTQSRLRRVFVQQQLQQNDAKLQEALFALSQFQAQERALTAREKFAGEQSTLVGLEFRRDELETQKRRYEAILAHLKTRKPGADPELTVLISATGSSLPSPPNVQNNPAGGAAIGTAAVSEVPSSAMSQLYGEMQRLQSVRDSMTTGAGALAPTNPDVVRVDTLLSRADARLVQTVQGLLNDTNDRLAQLDKLSSRGSAAIAAMPQTATDEARLADRADMYRKAAEQLREEYQKALLAEAAEVGQVEILDLAPFGKTPIAGGRAKKVTFGLLFGLMLGGGTAFLLEHLNTAIRRREDLESALQLPGLAVIPSFVARNGRRRRRLLSSGNALDASPDWTVPERLIILNNTRSGAAEAIRQLRTKLLFAGTVQRLKTLAITSTAPQDGKSTLSANLAAAFAQQGLRVVLIDCDLRNPTQHKIFDVSCEPGLTQLLAGAGMVPGTGRRTAIEGLSLITAGSLPIDPAELLGSPRMREVLTRLSDSFDIVILDTPPVLPVADAAILGQIVDGVVLVVRAGQTNRNGAQIALQHLADVNAHVIGAVLNDPDAQVPHYGDYGYYAYYGEQQGS